MFPADNLDVKALPSLKVTNRFHSTIIRDRNKILLTEQAVGINKIPVNTGQ